MVDIWTYRIEVFPIDESAQRPDIVGFQVLTSDGHKIGKIDEATNEVGDSWIVVDTGFWIFGKKRLVPAGTIQSIDVENQEVRVAVNQDDVKEAPDYDQVRHNDQAYRGEVGNYYEQRQANTGRAPATGRR